MTKQSRKQPDAKPRIDVEFEETPCIRRELFPNFIKGPINLTFRKLKDLESLVNTSRLVKKIPTKPGRYR